MPGGKGKPTYLAQPVLALRCPCVCLDVRIDPRAVPCSHVPEQAHVSTNRPFGHHAPNPLSLLVPRRIRRKFLVKKRVDTVLSVNGQPSSGRELSSRYSSAMHREAHLLLTLSFQPLAFHQWLAPKSRLRILSCLTIGWRCRLWMCSAWCVWYAVTPHRQGTIVRGLLQGVPSEAFFPPDQ